MWPVNAKRKNVRQENQGIDMRLFCKTWKNDYGWLKYAIKSVLSLSYKSRVNWTIVGDTGSRDDLRKITEQAMQETNIDGTFRIFEAQEHWPEVNGVNGYYAQQWIKMTAHRVMGNDYFINWDSDVIATRAISEDTFRGRSGRPIYWFSQFNCLIQGGDVNVHNERRNVMKEIIGIPEVNFEYMRCMPMPMNADILRAGEGRQEWSKSLNAIKSGRGGFSEFNIIGLFSHLHFPDCYEWRNAEQQGPTWSGSWEDAMVKDHVKVTQSWSWGGMQKKIEEFVNAL